VAARPASVLTMIRTLALISQKGGSGKTTLALALAAAHEFAGRHAAVIDRDPQGSATVWGRLRDGVPPVVTPAHPPRLARVIAAAADAGASLAMVDTAPREAGGAAEVARLAGLVLIPCRPASLDLAAVPATLATVGAVAALAVLNACPPRGRWVAEASEAVRTFGLGVAPVTLGARVAHAKAFTLGRTAQETEPSSPAAAEAVALYRWAMEALS